ncbi:MAG: tetratricopeptide repeat protein [Planctomycetota bacterium]
MADPLTISGLIAAFQTNSFLIGVGSGLVASQAYDSGKLTNKKIKELVVGRLREGRLPTNHHLEGLAQRSLRAALAFVYTSCAAEVGDKQPFFPAVLEAWRNKTLFNQPLIKVADTAEHAWLRAFYDLVHNENHCRAFDTVSEDHTLFDPDTLDPTRLASPNIDQQLNAAVTDRLDEWTRNRIESPGKHARSIKFQEGLERGFLVNHDSSSAHESRRLSLYTAWCLFFRDGLKTDTTAFRAYVIARLSKEPSTANAGLDDASLEQLGQTVAEKLAQPLAEELALRFPDQGYFDLHFKTITLTIKLEHEKTRAHQTTESQRVIDELKEEIATLRSAIAQAERSVPRLPAFDNAFIGRKPQVEALLQTLNPDTTNPSVADGRIAGIAGVGGAGGIGKTALAIYVGDRLAKDGHCPDGQAYIDLRGTTEPLSPRAAMESLLRQYDSETVFKDTPDDALAGYYRGFFAERRALLLLDNAAGPDQVHPLIPGGNCRVIVTARENFLIHGQKPLRLDVLSEEDAIALAQSLAPRLTEAEANDLAAACGRLALAVRIAATHLSIYDDLPPAEYLDALRSDALAELDEANRRSGSDDGSKDDEAEERAFARRAIGLSLDRLDAELKLFWARLGVFTADFAPDLAVKVAAAEEVEDDQAVKAGLPYLRELRRHALIEFDEASNRYRLHDLARAYAWRRAMPNDAARLKTGRRHASVFSQVLAAANALYLEGKSLDGLGLYDAEATHIRAAYEWTKRHRGESDAAARLAAGYYNAGVHVLRLRLHIRTQIEWLETAIDACRKFDDRTGEGAALGNLGLAVAGLGDTYHAVGLHEQHLKVAREIGDREGESIALGNLGSAYKALGDTRKAIEYHEQALVISREIGDRRGEGQDLGNLGNAHAALGDTQKAIGFHEQCLEVAREISDREIEGNALGNLGNAHAGLGDTRKAIGYYEQQLEITREIGDRRGEGNACFNRGAAYAKLEDWAEAADDLEAAAAIFTDIESPHAERAAGLAAKYRGRTGG